MDIDRTKSRLPGDTDLSDLINEELSDPVAFYYGKVMRGRWWGECGGQKNSGG